jgi:hypothetical protein
MKYRPASTHPLGFSRSRGHGRPKLTDLSSGLTRSTNVAAFSSLGRSRSNGSKRLRRRRCAEQPGNSSDGGNV